MVSLQTLRRSPPQVLQNLTNSIRTGQPPSKLKPPPTAAVATSGMVRKPAGNSDSLRSSLGMRAAGLGGGSSYGPPKRTDGSSDFAAAFSTVMAKTQGVDLESSYKVCEQVLCDLGHCRCDMYLWHAKGSLCNHGSLLLPRGANYQYHIATQHVLPYI